MQHKEREITDPVQLCDPKGQLNPQAIGYARKPLIESNLHGHFLRKKKWNYWCVFGEDISFSATICHLDYATVCFVYFLNYETQRFFEKTVLVPFTRHLTLSSRVLDTCRFQNDEVTIDLVHEEGRTKMTVEVLDFDGETLQAGLQIRHPEQYDSLNVVIPRSRQLFQFTGKYHSLPVSGFVRIGDQRHQFDPEHSFAVLDFGRGIWPRETEWNWAMASQRSFGKVIGLNFGGKWTDGTGMTENAFFVNGKMRKIHEDVLFDYNEENRMQTWKIRTKFSDDVRLSFVPFFERTSSSDLRLIKSETHQLYGYFSGYVRYEDGSKLLIRQLLGAVEDHYAKW